MSARSEPMSGVDTAWLHMDRPANLMQIVGVFGFRRRLDLAALRERIATRFLVHPRFRMTPVEGLLGAAWQPAPDVDLDAHVRQVVLPRGAGEAGLRRLLGRLASAPLDPARPRWEFVLVQVSPRRSTLVARIHHCYADGIALVRVVLGLADEAAPQGPVPHDVDASLAVLAPDWLVRAWRESGALLSTGLHLASHPAEAGELAAAGLGIAVELAQLALLPDEPPSLLRGALSGDKRVAWARPVPLERVRTAAKALGCTINDVLVSATADALAHWLRDQGGGAATPPELRAVLPVNLRAPDSPEPLGNRFGLVFLGLPVGDADARARLRVVRERMLALKGSHQPLVTLGLLATLGSGPRALQNGAVDLLSRKATLVLSNVPGPREPLRILGAPADSMMFWVPQSGDIGLGLSVLTYAGSVRFGVMADAARVADPERLAAHFPVALARVLRLAPRAPARRAAISRRVRRPRP